MPEICPLCRANSQNFYQNRYFICPDCSGVFLAPHLRIAPDEEKARYEKHNNDVSDPRYQKFVQPVVTAVLAHFSPEHCGLDFGAGTGPVISSMLSAKGYSIAQYDPFFHNHAELLQQKYDYIVCCEVIEHFYEPAQEFRRLHSLLKENGKLFCMTLIYEQQTDFAGWFYKSDETHVFFYQAATLAWIKQKFGFGDLCINKRLIEFTR